VAVEGHHAGRPIGPLVEHGDKDVGRARHIVGCRTRLARRRPGTRHRVAHDEKRALAAEQILTLEAGLG